MQLLESSVVLPCGCMMQWDEDETVIAFCAGHTLDYIHWEGNDREFVKKIATPPGIDRSPLAKEMQ